MTRTCTLLLLLALAAPLAAEDAEAKFAEHAQKTAAAVADAHVSLARWCFKHGLNVAGREQCERARTLVPGHEKAMKELGYTQKKVEGEKTWVLDERKAPPAADGEVAPRDRDDMVKERDKIYREAAVEYVKLANFAKKLELAAHARAAFEQAVKYDPLNEEALTGAGWQKDELGDWISPREAAEREQTADALEAAPEAVALETLPEWTSSVFKSSAPLGMAFGDLTVIASGSRHAEAGKYAYAASYLAAALLGGKVEVLRVVLAADETEHKNYCETRHPGMPGLSADRWVVGNKEVEALLDAKDDKLGMERVVYTVAIFELRRRVGETTHPWFEVSFAGNLTRRLLGRVATSEFSGDASGPSESGRWKRTLRMLRGEGRAPALDKLVVARDPDETQVILAHFFTRYLCEQRAKALPDFCAALKSSDNFEQAFKSAFGQDSSELEQLFGEWFDAG
ncbi:MAG: hypothetical protein H6841_03435 [Planctomycetes bacterium]|nr:hypothetical protein [Planctomycetota bacterium]MCB9934172.1 hypothetical protein [Planctomycetota bacterium]